MNISITSLFWNLYFRSFSTFFPNYRWDIHILFQSFSCPTCLLHDITEGNETSSMQSFLFQNLKHWLLLAIVLVVLCSSEVSPLYYVFEKKIEKQSFTYVNLAACFIKKKKSLSVFFQSFSLLSCIFRKKNVFHLKLASLPPLAKFIPKTFLNLFQVVLNLFYIVQNF